MRNPIDSRLPPATRYDGCSGALSNHWLVFAIASLASEYQRKRNTASWPITLRADALSTPPDRHNNHLFPRIQLPGGDLLMVCLNRSIPSKDAGGRHGIDCGRNVACQRTGDRLRVKKLEHSFAELDETQYRGGSEKRKHNRLSQLRACIRAPAYRARTSMHLP